MKSFYSAYFPYSAQHQFCSKTLYDLLPAEDIVDGSPALNISGCFNDYVKTYTIVHELSNFSQPGDGH